MKFVAMLQIWYNFAALSIRVVPQSQKRYFEYVTMAASEAENPIKNFSMKGNGQLQVPSRTGPPAVILLVTWATFNRVFTRSICINNEKLLMLFRE